MKELLKTVLKRDSLGILLLPLLLLSFGQANAGEPVTQLNALLKPVSSMTARFEQIIVDGKGTELQNVTGEMKVKRPGQFIWATDDPFAQKIISNGTRLWIYDLDLDQVTVQKLDQRVANTPALLLSGDPNKIAETFTVTVDQIDADTQRFKLKPKGEDNLFESLLVTFSKQKMMEMDLLDSFGQKTAITFLSVENNPTLDASEFEFVVPEGVDVIADI